MSSNKLSKKVTHYQNPHKIFTILTITLILTLLISQPIFSKDNEDTTFIDEKIYEAISEENEARIIIVLKDSNEDKNSIQTLGDYEENIEETQEELQEFIEDLSQDFPLVNSNPIIDISSGKVESLSTSELKTETKNENSLSQLQIDSIDKHQEKLQDASIVVESVLVDSSAITVTINDEDTLDEIIAEKENDIEAIYLDYPVSINLDESIPLINADDVWELSEDSTGISFTGVGQTVCVIDTGIDYTHESFSGGCNPTNYSTSGDTETLSTAVESDHNYADSEDVTYTITMEGYENIALHFDSIILEAPGDVGGADALDRIYVYDEDYNTVAIYSGTHSDIWTPSSNGSTMYVRLVSDGSVNDYGFYIDQVINGTTNTTTNWTSCEKIVGGYDVYNDDTDPFDDHGHGTHVSGTVASSDSTYPGVAPDANLVSIKALSSSGSGYSSDVAAGVDWCVTNANRLNITVISMSLGGSTHYQSECSGDTVAASVERAYDAGISVLIATGNNASSEGISAPACVPYAIPIGSTTIDDDISSFTNLGNLLSLLAPGSNICSSQLPGYEDSNECGDGAFTSISGTSMATPHAAGAFALLQQYAKEVYDGLQDPLWIEQRFYYSGESIDDSSNSGNEYSRIDVLEALKPVIFYESSVVEDGDQTEDSSSTINVSSDIDLSKALLEWEYENGTFENITMDEENSTQFSYNVTYLSPGTHTFSIYANDSYSQTQTTAIEFTKVFFNSTNYKSAVNGNSIFTNDTVIFTANITENNINSSYVYMESNFSGTLTNYSMSTSDNYTFQYNFSAKNNLTSMQNLTYKFYAQDLAQNLDETQIYSFIVQNMEVDDVNITTPSDGSELELSENYNFNVTASDPDGDSFDYFWDFNYSSDGSSNDNSSDQNASYAFEEVGSYYVTVNVSDENSSYIQSITVEVDDTTAPEITSIDNTNMTITEGIAESQTITATASDPSDIYSLALYYNDTIVDPDESDEDSATWTFGNFSTDEEDVEFIVELYDNSSNYNSENTTYLFDVSTSSSDDSSSSSGSSSSGGGGGGSSSSSSSESDESTTTDSSSTSSSSTEESSSESTSSDSESDESSDENSGEQTNESSNEESDENSNSNDSDNEENNEKRESNSLFSKILTAVTEFIGKFTGAAITSTENVEDNSFNQEPQKESKPLSSLVIIISLFVGIILLTGLYFIIKPKGGY